MRQKMTPIISVVVLVGPTESRTLDLCVRSVFTSRHCSYEFLLVVNSSSRARISSLRAMYPKARVVSMGGNVGILGLNKAISLCRGDYIFFLDEDCEIRDDGLEQLARKFQAFPPKIAAIAGNVYNVNSKSFFWKRTPSLTQHTLFTFPGGATAFRKEPLREVGGFDDDFFLWLHEDDLALRLLGKGYEIAFEKDFRILHHDKEGEFRPFQAEMIFRNKAWLNMKHFSYGVLPLLMVRDLVWMVSFSLYKKTLWAFFHAVLGYAGGYFSSAHVRNKRMVMPLELQLKILVAYLSYTNG